MIGCRTSRSSKRRCIEQRLVTVVNRNLHLYARHYLARRCSQAEGQPPRLSRKPLPIRTQNHLAAPGPEDLRLKS